MSDATGEGGCPSIHLHNYPSDGRLEQVLKLLREIRKEQRAMAVNLADIQNAISNLQSKVEASADVEQRAVTLLQTLSGNITNLAADLRAAQDNGTDDELRAQIDRLEALGQAVDGQSSTLAAAVTASTPANEPQPEPAPVEEPVPAPPPPEETPTT